jgi:hypothetical protein
MDKLLTKIKASIRITHDKLDEDVADTITACFADLRVAGLRAEKLDKDKELDPLILNAVKLYCRAAYTDDPVKAARYQGGYDAMKSCLMYAEGYSWKEAAADE